MAEDAQATAIGTPFPAPPPFYKHFTKANLDHLAAFRKAKSGASEDNITNNLDRDLDLSELPTALRYLIPPPPPASGEFTFFGSPTDLTNTLPTLSSQNISQLYPSNIISNFAHDASSAVPNHADKLIHLTRSILLNYLELIDVLAKDPTQYGDTIEDLRTLFYNAHHLLNEYRPHQARESLIGMMKGRMEEMRREIEGVEEMERRVGSLLEGVGSEEVGGDEDGVVDDNVEREVRENEARLEDARMMWRKMEAIRLESLDTG